MIRVSLPVLVFIYLVALLATVFGSWLVHEWRRQRRERHAFRHVLRCTLCGFEFEDQTGELLARCPRCGSLNERYRLSRL
jgi:rubrerythrin